MVKVRVKQDVSSKSKYIQLILVFILLMAFLIFKKDTIEKLFYGSKASLIDDSKIESILSKDEHLLSIDEWKMIAQYRAEQFYECAKGLSLDIESLSLYQSCAITYNNNWVSFQMGLDYKANLNYDQRRMLKEYWHKMRDEVTNKVKKSNEENEKQLRPNRYN